VAIEAPTQHTRWRCTQCGNLTRFDVVRVSRTREFWHQELSGVAVVEETQQLAGEIESVSCRWCAGGGAVELVDRPAGEAAGDPVDEAVSEPVDAFRA
jgi:hypothetical protein